MFPRKTSHQTNHKKAWVEHALKYIDHYAEKVVLETSEGHTVFGYKLSRQVLEDALNGRPIGIVNPSVTMSTSRTRADFAVPLSGD